jgi:hypothetical protein
MGCRTGLCFFGDALTGGGVGDFSFFSKVFPIFVLFKKVACGFIKDRVKISDGVGSSFIIF